MRSYNCHICGGACDPGELENGVCFECRKEAAERRERHILDIRKELNQMIRCKSQADGQMVMELR